MRKIIFSLVALIALTTSAYAKETPTYDLYDIKRAAGGREGEPSRVVKLVRFPDRAADTASIASGDVLVYDTVSDDGVSIQRTTASGDGAIAGIACTTIQTAEVAAASAKDDEGRRNWGYMVVHGPTTAKVTAGGTNGHVAGDLFITSTDSGSITTLTTRAGTGTVQNHELRRVAGAKGGFFLDSAVAADTTAEVFVILE